MERNLFDGWVTLRARKHPKTLNGLAETLSEFELSANVIKANNDSSGRIDRNKAIDFYLRDDFFFLLRTFHLSVSGVEKNYATILEINAENVEL